MRQAKLRRRPMAAIVVLAVGALALSACARSAPPAPPPPKVSVITLQPENAALTTELPGRTVAYSVSDVRPQVTGIIKYRSFVEGAAVKAGDELYLIDQGPYVAAYESAKAQLANAEAAQASAQLKAERYAELVKINAVSRQDFDDADAAGKQAAAAVASAKAAVKAAGINLGYTRVRAPISGRIGRSSVTAGALVSANQAAPLAIIQTLDPIYVDLSQSSDEILRLRRQIAAGDLARVGAAAPKVRLQLSDGGGYPIVGELKFAETLVNEATGSVTLRALFRNPDGLLLPGMFVRASFEAVSDQAAILAPQEAISRNDKGEPTALVVGAGDKIELRVLTAPQTIGNRWLVTSGLNAGDRLVMDGQMHGAAPGAKVTPVPYRPPAKPAGPSAPPTAAGGR